ncbi:unnamed protein product [Amoebophrya sp. A120]|nr:unnamed protein product [Amoebophrya sp. A120]|eukprot:GSA120T00007720001.1
MSAHKRPQNNAASSSSSAQNQDPYQALSLPYHADEKQIRQRFKELAKSKHPDKGGSKEEFQKILAAYELLQDEEKRKEFHFKRAEDPYRAAAGNFYGGSHNKDNSRRAYKSGFDDHSGSEGEDFDYGHHGKQHHDDLGPTPPGSPTFANAPMFGSRSERQKEEEFQGHYDDYLKRMKKRKKRRKQKLDSSDSERDEEYHYGYRERRKNSRDRGRGRRSRSPSSSPDGASSSSRRRGEHQTRTNTTNRITEKSSKQEEEDDHAAQEAMRKELERREKQRKEYLATAKRTAATGKLQHTNGHTEDETGATPASASSYFSEGRAGTSAASPSSAFHVGNNFSSRSDGALFPTIIPAAHTDTAPKAIYVKVKMRSDLALTAWLDAMRDFGALPIVLDGGTGGMGRITAGVEELQENEQVLEPGAFSSGRTAAAGENKTSSSSSTRQEMTIMKATHDYYCGFKSIGNAWQIAITFHHWEMESKSEEKQRKVFSAISLLTSPSFPPGKRFEEERRALYETELTLVVTKKKLEVLAPAKIEIAKRTRFNLSTNSEKDDVHMLAQPGVVGLQMGKTFFIDEFGVGRLVNC